MWHRDVLKVNGFDEETEMHISRLRAIEVWLYVHGVKLFLNRVYRKHETDKDIIYLLNYYKSKGYNIDIFKWLESVAERTRCIYFGDGAYDNSFIRFFVDSELDRALACNNNVMPEEMLRDLIKYKYFTYYVEYLIRNIIKGDRSIVIEMADNRNELASKICKTINMCTMLGVNEEYLVEALKKL